MPVFWDGGRKINPTDSCFGLICSKHRYLNELISGQNVNCSSKYNYILFTDIFAEKKMCTHIFFSKNIGIYAIFNDQSFNDTLTNDIVSFEQLGPGLHWSVKLFLRPIELLKMCIKMKSWNYCCPNITKTCLFNILKILPPNNEFFFFRYKILIFFLNSTENIDCGYSLEPPQWGGSNEYPQSVFGAEIRNIMYTPCKPQFYNIKVGFKGVKIV